MDLKLDFRTTTSVCVLFFLIVEFQSEYGLIRANVLASTYPDEVSLSKTHPTEMKNFHMEISSISHITHHHIRELLEHLMKGCDTRADSLEEPSVSSKGLNPAQPAPFVLLLLFIPVI